MKRRLLASLLAACMIFTLVPAALATDNTASVSMSFTYSKAAWALDNYPADDSAIDWDTSSSTAEANYSAVVGALNDLSAGRVIEAQEFESQTYYTVYVIDPQKPITITLHGDDGAINETIAKKVVFSPNSVSPSEDTINICAANVQISATTRNLTTASHTIVFGGGLEIQNGVVLTLDNDLYSDENTIHYKFGDDVTVGGSVKFLGNTYGHGTQGGAGGQATFSDGASLTIQENGEVILESVAVTGGPDNEVSTETPLITVEDGGSLSLTNYASSYPTVTCGGTAVLVKDGGSLALAAGKVTSTTEAPAIVVEGGGSIGITTPEYAPEVTAPSITTKNENEQAIDLVPGSTIKVDDATVTVGSAPGDNYVDNSGKIVLASGIVQVGEETTELPNGGTVTPAAGEGGTTVINPNVEGVTLDKDNLTLNLGETAQLTATVSPDTADKTVTWTSSDTNIATVDANGVVTAVGYGNATITVTAGGKTATCTVTVSYPYVPVAPTQPTKPAEPDQPEEPDTPVIPGALPFVDVSAGDWFYEDVAYVYAQGIMTGSTATSFAPNDAMTRAMVWTVLGRMSGENVEGGTPWYAAAQAWAVSDGVSDGTAPNDSITPEQLVTMLYRQAGSPEVGVSELALLGRFADGEAVSDWAEEAMAWAVSQGILTGDGDLLRPQATATRAQVAAILARYCANMEQ